MWNNLGINYRERRFRSILVNTASIFVMIFGFAGISYGNKLLSGKKDPFDINECATMTDEITEEMASDDYKDELSSNTILGCYCYELL
jgi:hypothetical protein